MKLFKDDPLQIIPFQSYGDTDHFYIRGRALEDENIDLSKRGFFSLLKNTWKRFETDEIPHTKLRVTFPDTSVLYSNSDHKGYFKIKKDKSGLASMTNSEGWLQYEMSFEDTFPGRIIQNKNCFGGEMLIPSQNSSFGVISDIDDTILHTGVTSRLKWKLIFNTLFKNAESRSPLKGASEFYNMLHRGKSGKEANPMFYVSHSPWNLYRYLELFLRKNNFPKGPILLRDFAQIRAKKESDEKPQKQKEIIDILNMYPERKFILIGDGGEHDPDIYIEIAESFPDRVLAIYIRAVRHKPKITRIKGLFESFKTTPALLVESGEQAIAHARSNGFIR
ncbi:MAG: phosphatase domain-containing protein [Marinirhabdus sp.]|nr:phosphatase domain-containing protein [Marinirhabdus sp.]